MKLKKIQLSIFASLVMIFSNYLTGCNTMNKIRIPKVSIDASGLGNNLIGERLREDTVWAGGARYEDGADASDKNDNVYPIIQSKIHEIQAKNLDIETALNASDLGVNCRNNICQYRGSYKRTIINIPNKVINGEIISTKNINDNVDIIIKFNPNKLEETYKINVQISKKEVVK